MTKIAVLGGSGFLGSRAVKALRQVGLEVAVASRRGEVPIDVTRAETFAALAPFELIIDVTDTVGRPPDAVIAWCLERGKTVIEATSEAPCVERLHAAHSATQGRLVLGGGIFTGLSNLLARDVAARLDRCEALTLGVASSPFSGAGQGTIELMLRAMVLPAVRYAQGVRLEEAMTRGPLLDFGDARRPTGRMSLAEPFMLHTSTRAPTVDVVFAPKPGLLVSAFVGLPPWLVRRAWFQAVMRAYFTVLRRLILSRVGSTVELVAESRRGEQSVRRWLHADDGMEVAGLALAAIAEAVLAAPAWTGVRFVDELCALEPVVARVNALAGRQAVVVGA